MSEVNTAIGNSGVFHFRNGGQKQGRKPLGILITVFTVLAVSSFLYFDRMNEMSHTIHSWGILGIVLSVVLMTGICMTPIPSEGLLVMFFKVFGVIHGGLYSWVGAMLGSVFAFLLARHLIIPIFRSRISADRFQRIEHWIAKRSAVGLLLVRLLPVPAFVQNYMIGAMPSISFWRYFWTGSVAILPYYVGTASLFLGINSRTGEWVAVGGVVLFALWITGFLLKRQG